MKPTSGKQCTVKRSNGHRLPSLSSTTHTPAWSLFMYQPRVQNRQHVYTQVTVTQCSNQAYRIENTLTYNLQVTSNHVHRIKNTFIYNLKVTSNCAYRIKNMFTYNFKGLATYRIKNTFTYNLQVTVDAATLPTGRIKNMFTYIHVGVTTAPTESRTLHTTYK